MVKELHVRGLLDDETVVQDGDAIADGGGGVEVVGNEKHGHAEGVADAGLPCANAIPHITVGTVSPAVPSSAGS